MSLPFLLNLIIGLIFIYLILSLIASEIQEILTTLLQWRAAHLKKSIEILLTGGEGTANDEKVKKIVKQLYDNPLIKNISQESKEGIEAWLRQASRFVVTLGRKDNINITLNGNEPSYMPSETFASTLMERLNLSNISQKITVFNLQRMIKDEIFVKVEDYISDKNLNIKDKTRQALKSEFNTFKTKLNAISVDLYNGRTTLLTSINRIRDEIDSFIEISKLFTPSISSFSQNQDSEEQENNSLSSQGQTLNEPNGDTEVTKFIAQLKSLKNGIFYQGDSKYNNANYNNTDELIRRLQPSPAHLLDLIIGEVKVKGSEITVFNLQRMIKDEILVEVKGYINAKNLNISDETRQALKREFETFTSKLDNISVDLHNKKINILTSINRITNEIDSFIKTSERFARSISSPSVKQDSEKQENNPSDSQSQTLSEPNGDTEVTKFIAQLKSLKNRIFYQGDSKYNNAGYNNTDESPAHILYMVIGEVKVKGQEIVELSKTYRAFQDEFGDLNENDEIYKAYEDIKKEIEEIGNRLPESTRKSLAALAKRAEINLRYAQGQVQSVEDEIYQFKTEVQVWFDRSMERASGVYKRNAKGIAFLIGFLLAIAVNADTFHIISRLTTDSTLRDGLNTNAELVTKDCLSIKDNTNKYLECVRQKVNSSISLPLGWDKTNVDQQAEESKGWFWSPLARFLGWIISGFAIMMGAPFWFELLGKIINVRNAGKPPEKSIDRQGTN